MKRRKYLLILGAVIGTLLMISSATAVNFTENQTDENTTGNNPTFGEEPATPPGDNEEEEEQPDEEEAYIDPNIELAPSITQITKLEKNIDKIDDPEFKLFTQELIKELKKDGVVDAQDIKKIRDSNAIFTDLEFYMGAISASAGDYCSAGGFPRLQHRLYEILYNECWSSWPGLGLWVTWDCSYEHMFGNCNNVDVDVTVGGHTLDRYHKGRAYFQLGYWEYRGYEPEKVGVYTIYQRRYISINAVSPLIVIIPGMPL